ncbi:MAG: hypothetical protein ACI9UA_002283 [Pseudoalteromonas tetraodonis]|jgi:hypothetical protein
MTKSTAKPRSDYPDFGVRYETISGYFEPPLARSTFHDKVQDGTIVPMKGMRGFYLLNESLRRLGLREVRELPTEPESRSLEDIVRLAFTLIDHEIFPDPSWLLHVEEIDLNDADHARKLADQYREKVASLDSIPLKLSYFQGVLDWVSMAHTK